MKVFVTGATGFIGAHVAEQLRARADDVVALVRSPAKADSLKEIGCELVQGQLADEDAVRAGVTGCDAILHIAGAYKVGVTEVECKDMHRTNVDGTESILKAGTETGVGKIVYVSTINYFGNTFGLVLKEGDERPSMDFISCYDETKYRAHVIALEFIERGAPIVITQPGSVYGPNDHSQVGRMISDAQRGRAKMLLFPKLGMNMVHVEDAAAGIVLALDKGKVGESYILGGQIGTMEELVQLVAELSGHKPPRMTLPTSLIRASLPLAPAITKVMGYPPNLREIVKASDGVTYWATDDKARRELGYSARDLETGLRQMLGRTAES